MHPFFHQCADELIAYSAYRILFLDRKVSEDIENKPLSALISVAITATANRFC